ncbi:DUF6278 family protein [Streptomyces natalensis]|uniref:DUF3806 domain-containing protein n=1 Tax=Streptomyces natalensis ATCC 27448 TaxID=1240678 RepID=A0A0D7CH45_9ACTN|nr:DUF6278 family protein [Streptomyces natalensis]KIZ15528.1 hypothetical protein SNA_28750 [Streptomyces natalensis ATCC 27448]
MNLSFLDKWRKRTYPDRSVPLAESVSADPDSVIELLSECELLRTQAAAEGVELDDTVGSLEQLDQLRPVWRDDPEVAPWLGNDAGLYLGTVVVRTVSGAVWHVWPDGQPVVRLSSGREIDVVTSGHEWADVGAPELSQVYAEAAES